MLPHNLIVRSLPSGTYYTSPLINDLMNLNVVLEEDTEDGCFIISRPLPVTSMRVRP